jgi:hypothetical protein
LLLLLQGLKALYLVHKAMIFQWDLLRPAITAWDIRLRATGDQEGREQAVLHLHCRF